MAPSLKAVAETDSVATGGSPVTKGETSCSSHNAAVINSVSSSDNSNEAMLTNEKNDNGLPELPNQKLAPVPPAAATTTTSGAVVAAKKCSIVHEDPSKVPPDEMAFIHQPHFQPSNIFHRSLSNLDLSMRCTLCSEFFHCPVTLVPCLHNFCSLCIRQFLKSTYTGMKRKAECPQCNEPVKMPGSSDYEKGILANKSLEQQVDTYKLCREELRDSLVRLDVLEQEKELGILSNGSDGKKIKRGKRTKKQEENTGSISSKRPRRTVAKKSNHSSSSVAESDDNGEDDGSDEDYYDDDEYDAKMPSSNKVPSVANPPTKELRCKKPTVSYHSMNRKKLVELCQKEGLDSTGNESELKQRHSYYITLYNSECDSEHPKPLKELLKEVKNREKTIKIEAARAGPKKEIKYMKNLSESLTDFNEGNINRPTSGNEAWDAKFNKSFASLIAEAKKKKNQQGSSSAAGGGHQSVAKSGNGEISGVSVSMSHESGNNLTTNGIATLQHDKSLESGDIKNNDITSPSASIDSDKTVETPQKPCEANNNNKQPAKGKPSASKKRAPKSAKKSKARATASTNLRVADHGSWRCARCTYVNERNCTLKSICEMCEAPRPKETASAREKASQDVEVVNIDC